MRGHKLDYKSVSEINGNVVIEEVKNFIPKHIFECGQCFRWNKTKDETYTGTAFGRVIEVEKQGENVILKNSNITDFKGIWEDYFDLEREYQPIKNYLSEDPLLKESVEFGHGIRILNQEPFELLISFIISANNQIPRIKKCVDRISELWGDRIEYNGEVYYSFPNADQLSRATLEELKAVGLGFRAKYIHETVEKVVEAEKAVEKQINGLELNDTENELLKYHLDTMVAMPHGDCHKSLQYYSGVGPKVADCIMLFSMKKNQAFPVDVWVKKAMQYFYKAPETSLPKIRAFGQDVFGEYAGFAQQYLFYNARENKIKLGEE